MAQGETSETSGVRSDNKSKLQEDLKVRKRQKKKLEEKDTPQDKVRLYEWDKEDWTDPSDLEEDLWEKPITTFSDIGVIFHFVYWPKYVSDKKSENIASWNSDQEDSTLGPIERDIIAYSQRNLESRPLQSCLYSPQRSKAQDETGSVDSDTGFEKKVVEITFPRTIVYKGEGKDFGLALRPREKPRNVKFFLTQVFTRFRNGAIVLHLGFKSLNYKLAIEKLSGTFRTIQDELVKISLNNDLKKLFKEIAKCEKRQINSDQDFKAIAVLIDEIAETATNLHEDLKNQLKGISDSIKEEVRRSGVSEFELTQLVKMWEAGEGYDPLLVKFKLDDEEALHNIQSLAASQFRLICQDPRLKAFVTADELEGIQATVPDDFKSIRQADDSPGKVSNSRQNLSPEEFSARLILLGGTIQSMDKDIHDDLLMLLKAGKLQDSKGDEGDSAQRVELAYQVPDGDKDEIPNELISTGRSLTAIGTALFDVQNLDADEMHESLRGFELDTKTRYVLVNKGTFFCIDFEDRTYDVHASRMSCSPYLWLPHGVAIYNNFVLQVADEQFRIAQDVRRESEYQAAEIRLRQLVQEDHLKEVFHYSSEKNLLKRSSDDRGIEEQLKATDRRLIAVNGILDELRENRERVLQWILEIGVGFLAALQLLSGYVALRDLVKDHWLQYVGSSFAFTLVGLGILWFYFQRANRPHSPINLDERTKWRYVWTSLGVCFLIFSVVFLWAWSFPAGSKQKPTKDPQETAATPDHNSSPTPEEADRQAVIVKQFFLHQLPRDVCRVYTTVHIVARDWIANAISAYGRMITIPPEKIKSESTVNMVTNSLNFELNVSFPRRPDARPKKDLRKFIPNSYYRRRSEIPR